MIAHNDHYSNRHGHVCLGCRKSNCICQDRPTYASTSSNYNDYYDDYDWSQFNSARAVFPKNQLERVNLARARGVAFTHELNRRAQLKEYRGTVIVPRSRRRRSRHSRIKRSSPKG